MRTLWHPLAGVSDLRTTGGVNDGVSLDQPACGVLGVSADREQRLRISWQRNAVTGQVQGCWHLDGTDPGEPAVATTTLTGAALARSACGVPAGVAAVGRAIGAFVLRPGRPAMA